MLNCMRQSCTYCGFFLQQKILMLNGILYNYVVTKDNSRYGKRTLL